MRVRQCKVVTNPLKILPRDKTTYASAPLDPRHQEINRLALLVGGKRTSPRHFPPLLHAAAAAHRRAMHRLEDRMSAHGRLASVLQRLGRSEFLADEILRMSPNSCESHAVNVRTVLRRQPEPTAELRLPEPRKCLVPGHFLTSTPSPVYPTIPKYCNT